jgi:hypothetical protein
MSHADKCPICKGKKKPDCHGCSGKGWVTVSDDPTNAIPLQVINESTRYKPRYLSLPIRFSC